MHKRFITESQMVDFWGLGYRDYVQDWEVDLYRSIRTRVLNSFSPKNFFIEVDLLCKIVVAKNSTFDIMEKNVQFSSQWQNGQGKIRNCREMKKKQFNVLVIPRKPPQIFKLAQPSKIP